MSTLRWFGAFVRQGLTEIRTGFVKGVKQAAREFVENARRTEDPRIMRMLRDGYGEHFIEALSQHRQGLEIHPDDQAVLHRYGLCSSAPAESFETRRLARERRAQAVAGMVEAGYGNHYLEAFDRHERGEEVSTDDLAVLKRFGLAKAAA